MDENETSDWLNIGLGISDELDNFRANGRTIIQMDISDLKAKMPMESALKINKAILKASERDLQKFDIDYAEVSSGVDDLQPIEKFFKARPMGTEAIDESITSLFGDKFGDEVKRIKKDLEGTEWKKLQKECDLSSDELLVYASFLTSTESKDYADKSFKPFISRIPASFLKTKDFLVRLLGVLRKLPTIEEDSYDVKTRKSPEYFKVGETYVFPSFALGTKSKKMTKKKGEKETVLRVSGKTTLGHGLKAIRADEGDYTDALADKFIFEPEAAFKVTKIEEGEAGCVVCCEFIENGKRLALEDVRKEFEQRPTEEKDKISPSSSGPKYADPSPPSLSDLLKLGNNYKPMTLDDAIRKAGFASSEKFISEANGKMNTLKRILKDFDLTEEDIKSVFIYTLEDKENRGKSPYNVVNSALSKRSKDDLLPLRDYIFYLLQGLRSLPRFKKQGVLYRGVRMPQSVAKDIYREGRTLTWTSFTSTSTDEKKAHLFAGENGVIFEIHGKFRGYSIGTFSSFSEEEGKFD